jgi:hypothetical protein
MLNYGVTLAMATWDATQIVLFFIGIVLPTSCGISMLVWPRMWAERARRQYQRSTKPIKTESLLLKSDGAWRAFGIGMFIIAGIFGYYMWTTR